MNFFEGELRQMFGNAENISDAKFVGRTMLGKLGDDLLVKAQFISTQVSKQYDAIQVSILNRTDGVVDKETMLFGDIIGQKNTNITGRVNPYMWEESVGKAYWSLRRNGNHQCCTFPENTGNWIKENVKHVHRYS